MSGSKHFDKIAWSVVALILVVGILFMNGGAFGFEVMAHTMGYENRLFDNTRIHTIDIVMSDWDEFIDNATSEEYYTAALVIDGEAYKNVAIRGKGNTSLSSVASMNSDRYSFKVEFDHYDDSITYHGLDKLSLNNLIQDSTMMKDYLTYTMMYEFGAAAPLCSFVYITVNGDDWGLYLAVEGVEDSFLERNYGSSYGELYKPDGLGFGGGRGNGKDFNMDDFMNNRETTQKADQSNKTSQTFNMGNFDPSKMPNMEDFDFSQIPGMGQNKTDTKNTDKAMDNSKGGFGGFGGMGSSDIKLQYIDDNVSSYSNIWNNAKTDITLADQTRLIESLKKLSNGEQIESVVDIESVMRYFVVHNYVCNGDSYTGSMIHNYYLYEENGQMAMIPWDYNLAYGTFQGGNAQSTVNTPIDAPVSGGAGTDRPMWSWILSDESYTEMYHEYFAEFLKTVDVIGIIDNAYNIIKPYVEKDPTAFYTYDEFEVGVKTMRQFCTMRSESIAAQLANGETTKNMSYVDASGVTLSNMGSMGGGKGGFGGGMSMTGKTPSADRNQGTTGVKTPEQMPEMPEGFDPSQMMGGFGKGFSAQQSDQNQTRPSDNNSGAGAGANANRPSRDNAQMPSGNFGFNMNYGGNSAQSNSNWIWLAMSVLVLTVGLCIAKFYKY